MLRMPVEQILAKIKEAKQLTDEDLSQRIKQKMDQLSGLISREGAAHIIANELGVQLSPQDGPVKVEQVLVGMRSVELNGKVVRIFPVKQFSTNGREGKVASAIIGDETGTIRITAWGSKADELGVMAEGNIIKIVDAYVKENNNAKELHLNDRSRIIASPPGITVIVKDPFTEAPRKRIAELAEGMLNIEILGTIVQVYDIRFFQRKNQAQPSSVPEQGYVLNLILDDGSSNVRCVLFTQQVQQLLKKTHEELLVYMQMPESFATIKTDLLGEMVKVTGKTNKNAMFDRLEFVINRVDHDVNPEEEIKRLQTELAANPVTPS